jgi:hypothetical protein
VAPSVRRHACRSHSLEQLVSRGSTKSQIEKLRSESHIVGAVHYFFCPVLLQLRNRIRPALVACC